MRFWARVISLSSLTRCGLMQGAAVAVDGLIEAGVGHAVVEAFDAEEGMLGEGNAFDGEELLGIDGPIDGDEVVAEAGDLVEFFEGDDGGGGGGGSVVTGGLGGGGGFFGGG